MGCKSEARTRRNEESSKYSLIINKMKKLGLEDSIDDFEKVVGSSEASKRVVGLVRLREKETEAKKEMERRERKRKQKDDAKQINKFEADAVKSEDKYEFAEQVEIAEVKRPLTSISSVQNSPSTQSQVTKKEEEITQTEIKIVELEEAFEMVQKELENEDSHEDIRDGWDWAEENEKMWGEVALAPGATALGPDEWVVVGSWGKGGEDS
ncbi:hypothetical protein NHQ30_005416 [Ciborinia camelliae]|nr:hypothetical protein NHQ30_005416 [Ciborinia camelliae]